MNFFNIVPENFFNMFSSGSSNQELYLESVLVLWKFYSRKRGMVKRQEGVEELAFHFEQKLYALKEEAIQLEVKNFSAYGRYIIDRLVETGWLEKESGLGYEDINLIFPTYVRKFLEAIEHVETNSELQCRQITSSIYANLKMADQEPSMMYQYFTNACDMIQTLRDVLLTMNSQVRRQYQTLLSQLNANSILVTHDKYIEQIGKNYHPLKTEENIYRYRTQVMAILDEFEENEEKIVLLGEQLMFAHPEITTDEAETEVYALIADMKKILYDIDTIMNHLDQHHQQYIKTTVNRLNYCMNQNRNFKGNLVELMKRISSVEGKDNLTLQNILNRLSETIPLYTTHSLEGDSLYKSHKRKTLTEKVRLVIEDIEKESNETAVLEKYQSRKSSVYSIEKVEEYLHQKMGQAKVLNTQAITIDNDEEFIYLLLSYHYGVKHKILYRVEMSGKMVLKGDYKIPEMTITRKEPAEKSGLDLKEVSA